MYDDLRTETWLRAVAPDEVYCAATLANDFLAITLLGECCGGREQKYEKWCSHGDAPE
jgi:hypothetical protein